MFYGKAVFLNSLSLILLLFRQLLETLNPLCWINLEILRMKFIRMLLVTLIFLAFTSILMAQTEVIVPDLTGLNVPTAAAELNRAGLRLGDQSYEQWTAESGVPENSIGSQSIQAGSAAQEGAAVDVTVLSAPNIRLVYDDNDFTLVNLTDRLLDITGLAFNAVDGNQASFANWTGELRGKQCLQVWAVNRNGPKSLPECERIQNWLVTTRGKEHFWIPANGVTQFAVTFQGAERGVCNAAPPNSQDQPVTCELYIPSGGQGDVAEYVYFVYNTKRFIAMNPSEDRWGRFNRTIFSTHPNQQQLGASFRLGDPALFGNPDIVADIGRLAPQQCLLLKDENVASEPLPQTCDVIAQLDLPADQLFWLSSFEIEAEDKKRYTCPAAVEGKRTICVMPR
jgi:hypothetical protein